MTWKTVRSPACEGNLRCSAAMFAHAGGGKCVISRRGGRAVTVLMEVRPLQRPTAPEGPAAAAVRRPEQLGEEGRLFIQNPVQLIAWYSGHNLYS